MSVNKIYYTDAYRTVLNTEVVSRRDDASGCWYTFADTIFYPQGGGQEADKGLINNIRVLDVQADGQEIWHLLEMPATSPVTMALDWKNRYTNMQQHTGQHILSACFKERHQLNTLSVHLGHELTMIELETDDISADIVQDTEEAANEVIRKNIAIEPIWTKREDLPSYSIRRSIKTTDEKIRLIKIGEIDCVGCGGTHVQTTSEVGLIKIIGREKIRNHIRVKIKIGDSAYQYFSELHHTFFTLSTKMSSSLSDLPDKINQLLEENRSLGRKLNRMNDLWLSEYAKNLPESSPGGCYLLKEFSRDQLKSLSEFWIKLHDKPCLFISEERGKLIFFIRLGESQQKDLQGFINDTRKRFDLKGGGSNEFATGEIGLKGSAHETVEPVFKAFHHYFN